MSRERDRSLEALPGSSTSSGKIAEEVMGDFTEQLEVHAGRALSRLLRRVVVATASVGAGVGLGVGGSLVLDEDAPSPAAHVPASGPSPSAGLVSDAVPSSLLVPPADEHLLEACERAGADARRAIRDARLCVDTFTRAAETCDPADALPRSRRAGDGQDLP